jgi:hypothetical protein
MRIKRTFGEFNAETSCEVEGDKSSRSEGRISQEITSSNSFALARMRKNSTILRMASYSYEQREMGDHQEQ